MRIILALLLMVPAFAQQPASQTKPEAAVAQPGAPAVAAPAKAEEKPADSPATAAEGWVNGYIDFGYRWVTEVSGSFDQYRSVVNLGEGPKLFGVDLSFQDPKKRLFDRMDVQAFGWGGDPYNTARLKARKQKRYDLNFDYRNLNYFRNVQSYANPLTPIGFSARQFDTHRRNTSASLELFPGSRVVPFLEFERNAGYGNGVDTWLQGGTNEYAVPRLLRDGTNNYRGGVRVELKRFHATVVQGGTTFKDDSSLNWTGQNFGDRTTPLLGQTLVLTSVRQAYGIRGQSIYSEARVTANPFSWLDLYGQFLFSQPKTTVSYTELASGNLAQVSDLLFYGAHFGVATGSAIQPHVTGNAGFELRPLRRLRIVESWTTDRFHDAGYGLFTQQFLNTLSQPAQLGAEASTLNPVQVVNFNRQQVDVFFDISSKLTLRGGHRYTFGDTTVRAGDLSQSGSFASGKLERHVGLAGASFRPVQKLWFNLDYEASNSDQIYFRTSLNDYHRSKIRARYQLSGSLTLQAGYNVLHNENPSPAIRYDFENHSATASAFWTPNGGKRVSFTAEYERTSLHSDIRYLTLPTLAPDISSYRERAHTASSMADVAIPRLSGGKLSLGGSFMILTGTRPTQYFQPIARLSLPIQKHVYWNTEWRYYGFGEEFLQFEGFRTHVFTTGIRLTR
jgi:hypothetical protein